MKQVEIKKRKLGNTGIEVSELGFGAWAIGGSHYGKVDETESAEAIYSYLNAGGNFIDTARAYGESEEVIGNILKKDKVLSKNIILCSKTFMGEKMEQIPSIQKELEI